MQARVESAKTVEERMDAQKDLADFDEKLNRERVKAERTLNKDILKEKKEVLKKKYEEEIKTIEDTKKAEEEAAASEFEAEKKSIAEQLKLKVESIKEIQELERDALKERQTEYKDYLREQRELAIANSKAIYEEDLAKFKLNQALKYEETVSSEAQMKKAIQEYAYKNMQPGNARDSILRTNDLSEMLKYYNPSAAIKSAVPQTPSLDYGLLEEIVAKGMKKADIKIYLDKKMVGSFVEDKVNGMLRK